MSASPTLKRVPHTARIVATLIAAVTLFTGCRISGLAFVKSSEFRFVSPKSSTPVTTLPLRVTWSSGTLLKPGDRYALFMDQGPISVGVNILSLVPQSCRAERSCAVNAFLAQQYVWQTTKPWVTLSALPTTSLTGNSSGRQEESLTVVILNRVGVRTGEEFATEDFVYIAKGV